MPHAMTIICFSNFLLVVSVVEVRTSVSTSISCWLQVAPSSVR